MWWGRECILVNIGLSLDCLSGVSRHYSIVPSLGETEEGGGLGSILVGVPVLVFWDLDLLGLNTVSGGSFLELLGVALVAPRGGHSSLVGDGVADTEA